MEIEAQITAVSKAIILCPVLLIGSAHLQVNVTISVHMIQLLTVLLNGSPSRQDKLQNPFRDVHLTQPMVSHLLE